MGPLRTNFSEILSKIQNFSFTKLHLKITSVKWWSFCPGEGELKYMWFICMHSSCLLHWHWCDCMIVQTYTHPCAIEGMLKNKDWISLQLNSTKCKSFAHFLEYMANNGGLLMWYSVWTWSSLVPVMAYYHFDLKNHLNWCWLIDIWAYV